MTKRNRDRKIQGQRARKMRMWEGEGRRKKEIETERGGEREPERRI